MCACMCVCLHVCACAVIRREFPRARLILFHDVLASEISPNVESSIVWFVIVGVRAVLEFSPEKIKNLKKKRHSLQVNISYMTS